MADLEKVYLFFDSGDHYHEFLHRVGVALVEKALDVRADPEPNPVTGVWVARQHWAGRVLGGSFSVMGEAKKMLPALAVIANDAGLIDDDGFIDATDTQIRGTITDDLVDKHAAYVPELP